MATNAKTITDNLRNSYVSRLMEFFATDGDVMQTASGTLYLPAVDECGDDRWVKISVIIPKASEEEGTDGYALAKEYTDHLAEQAEKAREAEAKKAKKLAEKEAKAKAKAEKAKG